MLQLHKPNFNQFYLRTDLNSKQNLNLTFVRRLASPELNPEKKKIQLILLLQIDRTFKAVL